MYTKLVLQHLIVCLLFYFDFSVLQKVIDFYSFICYIVSVQISMSGTMFKLFVSQYSIEKSGGCRLWIIHTLR